MQVEPMIVDLAWGSEPVCVSVHMKMIVIKEADERSIDMGIWGCRVWI